MGTPLLSAVPACLLASLFLIVWSLADVCGCGAPLSKRSVMVANDEDIKDLLGNEEQSVATKLAVTILQNMLGKHGRRY